MPRRVTLSFREFQADETGSFIPAILRKRLDRPVGHGAEESPAHPQVLQQGEVGMPDLQVGDAQDSCPTIRVRAGLMHRAGSASSNATKQNRTVAAAPAQAADARATVPTARVPLPLTRLSRRRIPACSARRLRGGASSTSNRRLANHWAATLTLHSGVGR